MYGFIWYYGCRWPMIIFEHCYCPLLELVDIVFILVECLFRVTLQCKLRVNFSFRAFN